MFIEVELIREAPPIRQDEFGALRVGDSRVLVDLVISAFEAGATPETIADRYPSTTLTDIYSVIAYYLRHREQIRIYIEDRKQQAQAIRATIEERQLDMHDIRDRLLARWQEMTA